MSYIQPENSNRVNSIKQRFESKLDSTDGTEARCQQPKEPVFRTLSASPAAPRKNLKLNVARQLSNPGRNIKRSPAFRGDKLTRTKNLISPTKEKAVSLVDKNVKLFQEKPEHGKLGNVQRKDQENLSVEHFDLLYDDVLSVNVKRAENDRSSRNNTGDSQNDIRYGASPADGSETLRTARSQSLDRKNNSLTSAVKTTECKDGVRTTVISRQKNISSLHADDNEDESIYGRSNLGRQEASTNEDISLKPNKFFKNGVEYTRVLKSRSKLFSVRNIDNEARKRDDKRDHLAGFTTTERASRTNSQKNESSPTEMYSDAIDSGRSNVNFVSNPDQSTNEGAISSKSTYAEAERGLELKLTDTLKAALKAPLPSGPPPKKPPRTFAHSPIINRSPVNDYEEVDGFWRKQKVFVNELTPENDSDNRDGETEHRMKKYLDDAGMKQFRRSLRDRNKRLSSENCRGEEANSATMPLNRNRNSVDDPSFHDKQCKFELEATNKSISLAKLGISSKKITNMEEARDLISSIASNRSTSSEDNSTSPQNTSHLPQKFKTSPVRLQSLPRRSRDSKEMLEKLENVLLQHQKACGPKIIIPRTDKLHNVVGSKVANEEEFESELTSRSQNSFQNRLSRTLEDGRRMAPLPNIPRSPEPTRNLAFDCLPSLNCATSSIYEQIQNPDFKTYLTDITDSKLSSLNRSENMSTKPTENIYSRTLLKKSHFYFDTEPEDTFHLSTPEPYDTLLMSPGSRRLSTELTTFSDGKKQTPNEVKNREHIYAQPYTFDHRLGTDVIEFGSDASPQNVERSHDKENDFKSFPKGKELHYMIEELLDRAFGQPVMAGSETPTDSNTSSDTDSLASTSSNADEFPTFGDRLEIFKNKEDAAQPSRADIKRSLTEKRKHYVRRVSSKYSECTDSLGITKRNNLFEICLLVELNLSTKKPYIKEKYPIYSTPPAWIENFCFPDALDWPPVESDQDQAYTFVLTDEKGNRRYGYCRRVKPEGAPVCLPLAYCLITKHRASGFYFKVLAELESRHGQPDIRQREFIERLYNSRTPKPGEALRLELNTTEQRHESEVDVVTTNNNVLVKNSTNHQHSASRRVSETFLDSEKSYTEQLFKCMHEMDFTDDTIIRLGDHRLEERDMSQLFDSVSIKVLLLLFASLLLERKVVLISSKLSKLSSCVEALQSLLYPFSWPHPFIPFLPNIPEFSEILQAPSPFVIGILRLRNGSCIDVSSLEDGIVVDLDNSKVATAVGDESSILPSRLQKGLKSALQTVSSNTKSGDGFRNYLVSEAFLRVFVETCAHYESHIAMQQDGTIIFEKESFVKATPIRNVQYFLEWFVETTMFNQLIQERVSKAEGLTPPSENNMKLFRQRVAEYLIAADKNSHSKKGSNKKKTFGDRLKDLTSFN